MVIRFPEFFLEDPGGALNLPPFEAETYLDLTGPPGSMTGVYYSLLFQLGRWGFQRVKVDEWISVSPVFKQYFDLTLQQKQALEAQIKAGLAQIASAIHDYELVFHDLRKYREFLDYFTWIEKGKKLLKTKKEEGEREIKKGEQTLKAIFIDQVDIHTDLPNTPIALRSIVGRWPTIIADFMRIAGEDTDPKKIADKYKFSEAEGVVLSTKNKLYLEWRDKLFRPTVEERYERVLRLTEARGTSINEYTNMLKPIIARFKLIHDALEEASMRRDARVSWTRPDAQAISSDFARVWAWRTFAPAEKYKITRESLTEIPATKAGFTKLEVKKLVERFKKKGEVANLSMDEEMLVDDGNVYALPVEPSIDHIVKNYREKVEKEYGVKITFFDVFEARRRLSEQFARRVAEAAETALYHTGTERGVLPGAAWVFSPYFVFIDVPMLRLVVKLPDGTELENLMIENLRTATRTQNVIIVNILEVIAREKQLENYISQLVGETGGKDMKTLEELKKEAYPEIFGELEKMEKKKSGVSPFKKIKNTIGDVLRAFGLTTPFVDYLRARGPYEFALDDRLTEIYQPEPGNLFALVERFLQQSVNVPGVRW